MNRRRTTQVSTYLSRHLRHQPDRLGIELDAQGWTGVEELRRAAAEDGFPFSREELEEVVATSDKRRFVLDEDRIRAAQGHSVPVQLDLPAAEPPDTLYHGTVERFMAAILAEGLRPMERHAVHLSSDLATATRVGARRGRPVVLRVAAGEMHREGHTFTRSENGVWLAQAVPARFLRPVGGRAAPPA